MLLPFSYKSKVFTLLSVSLFALLLLLIVIDIPINSL